MTKPRDMVAAVIVAGVLLLIGFVVWRMLYPPEPVQIVIQAGDDEDAMSAASALAMGERMGQSAEWTIATILVIGSALVGLNWYQSDRRYRQDMDDLNRRIETAEQTNLQTVKVMAYKQLADAMGNPDEAGFVGRSIQLFRTTDVKDLRQLIAVVLASWASAREYSDPTLPVMQDVPVLQTFLPDLKAHFPEQWQIVNEVLPRAGTKYQRMPDNGAPES